jgi:hypothetical protein
LDELFFPGEEQVRSNHSNNITAKDVMCPCMDEISIIWMNCFFLAGNKSEAITEELYHSQGCYVSMYG